MTALKAGLSASENENLSLDELDDKEFDIPQVTNPPTLESILNEPDEDSLLATDDGISPSLLQGDKADCASICSQASVLSPDVSRQRLKRGIHYAGHGSVLRQVALRSVSAQMISAAERVDAGKPSALCVSSLVAVGTSHGLVLVFDSSQVMKWCLEGKRAEYGAVSAMCFNRDCTRLLAGYANGQITMWDLNNGKLLRTITDVHPPGTAILHVKFTDDLTLAVCSDSGGSVYELEFKRLMVIRSCESKCLFSGSRGEVCVIEPLLVHRMKSDHPVKDVILLAMCSLSKVLLVTVRPELSVIFVHPLKGDAATLPLIAWQFVVIEEPGRSRTIQPVLAFARDQTILFYQVSCESAYEITCFRLQKTEVAYKLLSLTWLNSRTMVAIDTSERAHVIDVRSEEELEVIDLSDIQLMFGSSFYKSLSTGGNVSQALAYAGKRACYYSLALYLNQLVILGTHSVHVLTIRNWTERVDLLARHGKHQDSLDLALSFYEGRAKAVVGLLGSPERRADMIGQKIVLHSCHILLVYSEGIEALLETYVSAATTSLCPSQGKVEQLETHYRSVVPTCIDCCLRIRKLDVLFGWIYDKFCGDAIARAVFLESLEPYIVRDELTYIAPAVMKDFVRHHEQRQLLQTVERCIVHLDIASLDIHQVVSLCWEHGLYDALLYIYNTAMHDYTTPMEELLQKLRAAVDVKKPLTDDQVRFGNKLLVYISCCLAGRAYPRGDIPTDSVSSVKDQVFQRLTSLHSSHPTEDEPIYPHLKTLIQFDTREFFNVLALALEDRHFHTEQGADKRQRVIDILLQIMVDSIGFTPTQIGILFTFLARQMATPDNTIIVNRSLFEQVLESLCSGDREGEERHEERQQALHELINAGGLQHFNEDKLIELVEKAKFFKISERLYWKRREYEKIMNCYLRDTERQSIVFHFVEHVLQGEMLSDTEKEKVHNGVISSIHSLVAVSSEDTARLILGCFSDRLRDILDTLQSEPELLYKLLRAIFDCREEEGGATEHADVAADIHELYVELMCKVDKDKVAGYVIRTDGYRLQETLEICRRYDVSEATSFLLEKLGEVQEAFDVLLKKFQSNIDEFCQKPSTVPKKELGAKGDVSKWQSIEGLISTVIHFCQRNSPKMDESDSEALWFPLLDTVLVTQRKVDKGHTEAVKMLTTQALNGMMGYVALPAVLQRIMQDPGYCSGRFGEVRGLVLGMFDTYNYEKTLLHTCCNLLTHDVHKQIVSLTRTARHAIIPRRDTCQLCRKTLHSSRSENVICFRCGHAYHETCLKSPGCCCTVEGERQWTCYLCNSKGRSSSLSIHRVHRSISSSSLQPLTPPVVSHADMAHVSLDEHRIRGAQNVRRAQKTPTQFAELSRQERSLPGRSGALQSERFDLRLAAPLPFEND